MLTPTIVAGVEHSSVSVCLCVSVCPQHNSKNDPKVFKLGIGLTLGYPISDMVFRSKGQRSRSQDHKVQNTESDRVASVSLWGLSSRVI